LKKMQNFSKALILLINLKKRKKNTSLLTNKVSY
jgi:hypothetical protein